MCQAEGVSGQLGAKTVGCGFGLVQSHTQGSVDTESPDLSSSL